MGDNYKHCVHLELFTFLLFLLCGITSSVISRDLSLSQAKVDDKGRYQDIVVSINLRISKSADEKVYLDKVKKHLEHLSNATYDTLGLTIGNVTILVPSHWQGEYNDSFNQASESADMLIQPLNTDMYTQHIQGCGRQALFMAVNTDYIANTDSDDGTIQKRLLHEWMHARYGVFDEHPIKSRVDMSPDKADPTAIDQYKFYHSSHAGYQAIRCSLDLETETNCAMNEIRGYKDVNLKNFLPKGHCSFVVKQPTEPQPSLMSHPAVDKVELVCDDKTHNSEAPNRHNRLCNGRSVKDILKHNQDLIKLGELGGRAKRSAVSGPVFNVKRLRQSRTIVFVVDTSVSMDKDGSPRLFLATQAIGSMIEHIIEDYARILIVGFAKEAYKLYPSDSSTPVELDSQEKREEAVQSLTSITTEGFTCIGCGLELGYNLTKEAGRLSGAFFVLLTDGAHNVKPELTETIYRRSEEDGFFIDTILLSDEADEKLADLSSASSRIFAATDDSSALIDGFTDIIINRQNLSSQVIQIYSQIEEVKRSKEGTFRIEKELIEHAEVVFYWNVTAQPHLTYSLTRENDDKKLLTPTNASTTQLGYLKVSLGNAHSIDSDVFHFKYLISNNHPSVSFMTTVTVNTRKSTENNNRGKREVSNRFDQPYSMRAFVDGDKSFNFTPDSSPTISICAFLPSGSTPELPTDVVATVTVVGIEHSNLTEEFNIKLRDLGTGADVIGGDGLYSAYFTNFVSYNATYYVRVRAAGPTFMRYASTGFFSVFMQPSVNISSTMPPSPIMDLQVVGVSPTHIDVTFTAPGDDLDFGNAAAYRAHYAFNAGNLRRSLNQSSWFPIAAEYTPQEAYSLEEFYIELPEDFSPVNQTVWLMLTAIDADGLESNASNLVSFRYIEEAVNVQEISIAEIPTECPSGTIFKCLPDLYFWLIIGGAALLFLLLLILIICLAFRRCRKKAIRDDVEDLKTVDAPDLDSERNLGDLAEHDHIYMPHDQIQAPANQTLASVKKRVQSTVRRLSMKSVKPQAPPPKPKQNGVNGTGPVLDKVWMGKEKAPIPKQSTQTVSNGVKNVLVCKPSLTPKCVDNSAFTQDLETGETLTQNFIRDESQKNGDVSHETPDIQL